MEGRREMRRKKQRRKGEGGTQEGRERREGGKEGGMAQSSELYVPDTQVTFALSAPLPVCSHTHTQILTGNAKP